MKKNVRIQIADPSGNVTIFVLDPFPRSQYAEIGRQLLDDEKLGGEQVGFITGKRSLEMCGLEFCGNASRAFACCMAKAENIDHPAEMQIRVSGAEEPLNVYIDPAQNFARTQMPRPRRILTVENSGIFGLDGSRIIDLGGIMHLVTDRLCPSREQFDEIRAYVMEEWHPAAMGVMFLESAEDGCAAGSESDGVCHLSMTPYVYVADVDSTYAEGSCASGSEAAAAALSAGKTDGTYRYELTQPAGVITASCTVRNGQTAGCEIEGSVTCGEIQEYTLELS